MASTRRSAQSIASGLVSLCDWRSSLWSEAYEQAVAPLRSAINRFPTFITPRRHRAATYAQLGRIDEAKAEIAAALRLDPSLSISMYRGRVQYVKPEDLEHYLDGLRKAGLPAGGQRRQLLDEPLRQCLGQCGDGELLLLAEHGTDSAQNISNMIRGQGRRVRLH